MVEPLVPLLLEATLVTVKSALVTTGVTTLLLLLPGVGSVVPLVPLALLVTLPLVAVTVAVSTRVKVWLSARLVVATAPLLLELKSAPPVTTGVPDRLKPALSTSVRVTLSAVLGPKLTSVTV